MISIENDFFSAGIRIKGAELASLKNKTTGQEYIWQADPEIWGSSAPILFPIIGKLKSDVTRILGTSYEIPKHGVLRTRDAQLVEQKEDRALFLFKSDEETLKCYPFPFVFNVEFQLTETGLEVNYTVNNPGTETMLFSVGSHPAFALDLEVRTLSNYSIEFSEPETLDLYGFVDGYLGMMEENYLREQSSFQLEASVFEENALIFQNIKSRTIRLNPIGIEVDIRNHPHLGIWQTPGAPYICIEPWHSFDDTADSDGLFENKPGIMKLKADGIFETGYAIHPV